MKEEYNIDHNATRWRQRKFYLHEPVKYQNWDNHHRENGRALHNDNHGWQGHEEYVQKRGTASGNHLIDQVHVFAAVQREAVVYI